MRQKICMIVVSAHEGTAIWFIHSFTHFIHLFIHLYYSNYFALVRVKVDLDLRQIG